MASPQVQQDTLMCMKGLAMYSSCGVWGSVSTTYLQYGGPLLGFIFKMKVGLQVCYDAWNFPLILLPSFMYYALAKFC